ncbi:hypothetical protein O181_030770 [Austropuccinia psidii MF-1]|uniref:Uncharacterized protein n=1 Tax=Austropuccinia psidii MF-1 TaxID=1389203 RepID=A0A9Q3CWR8_9BASI|nr:hypothetical protein [Austropuccinia psidii MF-1]
MFKEDFHTPNEIIVGKLYSLCTRTAKKCYYKMRQDHGEHDWIWWKSEIITKWANNSWILKIENAFESAIFNSGKAKPLTWFLKKKDRLSSVPPDMSDSIINIKILRKCGGKIETSIRCRCVEQNPVQQRTILMQWKISLLGQESVKAGLGKIWNPKWFQRFPEMIRELKALS